MGRRRYDLKRKEEWAVRLLQRNWRGKAGRELYLAKREERNAASMLQRIYWRMAKRLWFGAFSRTAESALQSMCRKRFVLKWRGNMLFGDANKGMPLLRFSVHGVVV